MKNTEFLLDVYYLHTCFREYKVCLDYAIMVGTSEEVLELLSDALILAASAGLLRLSFSGGKTLEDTRSGSLGLLGSFDVLLEGLRLGSGLTDLAEHGVELSDGELVVDINSLDSLFADLDGLITSVDAVLNFVCLAFEASLQKGDFVLNVGNLLSTHRVGRST